MSNTLKPTRITKIAELCIDDDNDITQDTIDWMEENADKVHEAEGNWENIYNLEHTVDMIADETLDCDEDIAKQVNELNKMCRKHKCAYFMFTY